MQEVSADTTFGDLRADCPFCGHYNVIGKRNRGDVCCHLVAEDSSGAILLFDRR